MQGQDKMFDGQVTIGDVLSQTYGDDNEVFLHDFLMVSAKTLWWLGCSKHSRDVAAEW